MNRALEHLGRLEHIINWRTRLGCDDDLCPPETGMRVCAGNPKMTNMPNDTCHGKEDNTGKSRLDFQSSHSKPVTDCAERSRKTGYHSNVCGASGQMIDCKDQKSNISADSQKKNVLPTCQEEKINKETDGKKASKAAEADEYRSVISELNRKCDKIIECICTKCVKEEKNGGDKRSKSGKRDKYRSYSPDCREFSRKSTLPKHIKKELEEYISKGMTELEKSRKKDSPELKSSKCKCREKDSSLESKSSKKNSKIEATFKKSKNSKKKLSSESDRSESDQGSSISRGYRSDMTVHNRLLSQDKYDRQNEKNSKEKVASSKMSTLKYSKKEALRRKDILVLPQVVITDSEDNMFDGRRPVVKKDFGERLKARRPNLRQVDGVSRNSINVKRQDTSFGSTSDLNRPELKVTSNEPRKSQSFESTSDLNLHVTISPGEKIYLKSEATSNPKLDELRKLEGKFPFKSRVPELKVTSNEPRKSQSFESTSDLNLHVTISPGEKIYLKSEATSNPKLDELRKLEGKFPFKSRVPELKVTSNEPRKSRSFGSTSDLNRPVSTSLGERINLKSEGSNPKLNELRKIEEKFPFKSKIPELRVKSDERRKRTRFPVDNNNTADWNKTFSEFRNPRSFGSNAVVDRESSSIFKNLSDKMKLKPDEKLPKEIKSKEEVECKEKKTESLCECVKKRKCTCKKSKNNEVNDILKLLQNQSAVLCAVDAEKTFYKNELKVLKDRSRCLLDENAQLHTRIKQGFIQELLAENTMEENLALQTLNFNLMPNPTLSTSKSIESPCQLSKQEYEKIRAEIETIICLHKNRCNRYETQLSNAREEICRLERENIDLAEKINILESRKFVGVDTASCAPSICVECGVREAVVVSQSSRLQIEELSRERDQLIEKLLWMREKSVSRAKEEIKIFHKFASLSNSFEQAQVDVLQARQFEREARENLLQVTNTLQDKLFQTEEQRKRELETISTENDLQKCQLKAKIDDLLCEMQGIRRSSQTAGREKQNLQEQLETTRHQLQIANMDFMKESENMRAVMGRLENENDVFRSLIKRHHCQLKLDKLDHHQEKDRLKSFIKTLQHENCSLKKSQESSDPRCCCSSVENGITECCKKLAADHETNLTGMIQTFESELTTKLDRLQTFYSQAACRQEAVIKEKQARIEQLERCCKQLSCKLKCTKEKLKIVRMRSSSNRRRDQSSTREIDESL